MIKVNISFLSKELQEGLEVLSSYYNFKTGSGIKVFCQKSESDLKVTYDTKSLYISCPNNSAFFRGFGHFLENADKSFTVNEKVQFRKSGLMFDSSRNGVLNVKSTKLYLAKMAIMGLNTYYPYMEDVYTLAEYPLFGQRRGKYTVEQLKEIDSFAAKLGIEVIPCIQTLAHLNQYLQNPRVSEQMLDIDNIIMVGSKETEKLIDNMLKTMSDTFRSRNVHVGLDEAHHLGLGRYLDKNGYKKRNDLMKEHLELVSKIADKYGLHIQMWDDMFAKEEEYNASFPTNVTPVYWNYYATDKGEYEKAIDKRKQKKVTPIFAGGAWRWSSYVPKHGFTLATSEPALLACKQKGVEEVFATAWGDDGDEGPAFASLFGLVFFAEHTYNKTVAPSQFESRLKFVTGMSYDEWMLPTQIDTFGENDGTYPCHKALLYNDPICGVHDGLIKGFEDELSAQHFVALSAKLKRSAEKCPPELKNMQLMYAYLCDILELKWDLSLRLRKAYQDKDRKKLLEICSDIVDYLIPRNEAFRKHMRVLWEETYSEYGFEIIDIRLGGLSARLKTVVDMIYEFDEGTLKNIPALEEEVEPIMDGKYYFGGKYFSIASASKF